LCPIPTYRPIQELALGKATKSLAGMYVCVFFCGKKKKKKRAQKTSSCDRLHIIPNFNFKILLFYSKKRNG
jgi:hypothetical protein